MTPALQMSASLASYRDDVSTSGAACKSQLQTSQPLACRISLPKEEAAAEHGVLHDPALQMFASLALHHEDISTSGAAIVDMSAFPHISIPASCMPWPPLVQTATLQHSLTPRPMTIEHKIFKIQRVRGSANISPV